MVGYFETDTSTTPLGVFMSMEMQDVLPDVSVELGMPFTFRVVASHRHYDIQVPPGLGLDGVP